MESGMSPSTWTEKPPKIKKIVLLKSFPGKLVVVTS